MANLLRTGSLTTTTTTANQVVLTYTVTAGKTLNITVLSWVVRLTVLSATASILGTMSVESPSGTKLITETFVNPTTSFIAPSIYALSEPIQIAGGVVFRVVCTPAAVTSTLWVANFGVSED